uniref:G-protein coupled receptors family 2 profile 2 domain-containing protein n=1 Tax=Trichuris muris TaxID=70415 RepID=A0A5S6QNF4_TRIMR
MKIIVDEEKERCRVMSANFTATRSSCGPDFDGSMCWESSSGGGIVQMECPFEFCSTCTVEDRFVERECFANLSWAPPNYDRCVSIYTYNSSCIGKLCQPCPDNFRETFRMVMLWLSVISALLMVASLITFSMFKSLQCRRLTIHKHLVAAFIIRFFIFIMWLVLQRDQVFHGCTGLEPAKTDWLCKLILTLIMYSTLASVFWMFLEGFYLVSRFTIMAMRSEEGHFVLYLLTGWGLPFAFVLGWVLALEFQPVVPWCWLPYTGNKAIWLLISPISVALGLNFLFLLIILALLIQKLWASNTIESKKIWKTTKATVLLVPLLGTTNLLLFYEPSPSNESAHQAYMLLSAILQHSQGIFVALFYCFGNGEVQLALKRQIERLRHYQPIFVKKRNHGSQATKFHRRYSEETMDSKI